MTQNDPKVTQNHQKERKNDHKDTKKTQTVKKWPNRDITMIKNIDDVTTKR